MKADERIEIICCECSTPRMIKPQDAFQVKRCAPCQRSYRIKLDAQRRKAKKAGGGTIVVEGIEVKVQRVKGDLFKVTHADWEALIEDGVDMEITRGDKKMLPIAIKAAEMFADGQVGA